MSVKIRKEIFTGSQCIFRSFELKFTSSLFNKKGSFLKPPFLAYYSFQLIDPFFGRSVVVNINHHPFFRFRHFLSEQIDHLHQLF